MPQAISVTIQKTDDVQLGQTPNSTVYGSLKFYNDTPTGTPVKSMDLTKTASENPSSKSIGATFGSATADCGMAVMTIYINRDGLKAEYTFAFVRT